MMSVSQYERPHNVTAANRAMVDVAGGAVDVPTAILSGQVALTGAAQNFPAGACKSVTIESPTTNAVVSIGASNAVTLLNGYVLRPGATVSFNIDNLNRIWVIGTAAQRLSYLAVN